MKVGDYVRTKSGYLRKIIAIYNGYVEVDDKCFNSYANAQIENENIKLTSPNIIDLIEEGDYVNGFKVDALGDGHYLIFYDGDGDWYIDEKDIERVVTKEQFESMEYKI